MAWCGDGARVCADFYACGDVFYAVSLVGVVTAFSAPTGAIALSAGNIICAHQQFSPLPPVPSPVCEKILHPLLASPFLLHLKSFENGYLQELTIVEEPLQKALARACQGSL